MYCCYVATSFALEAMSKVEGDVTPEKLYSAMLPIAELSLLDRNLPIANRQLQVQEVCKSVTNGRIVVNERCG